MTYLENKINCQESGRPSVVDRGALEIDELLVSINNLLGVIEGLMAADKRQNSLFAALFHLLKDSAMRLEVETAAGNDYLSNKKNQSKLEYKNLYGQLSPREKEILTGIVDGKMNKVIAYDLNLSVKTVEASRSHIKKKMQANSVAHLIKMVVKEEVI